MSSAPSATARRPGADAAAQKNKVPSKTTIKAGKKGSTSREKAGKGEREEENEYDSLEYIAPLPEEDEKACQPPQKISTKLVARRAFGEEALVGLTGDEIADRVLVLQHVRLDDERVEEIDNLEMLGVGVTHLYLQRNLISTIENLESMRNLQLLCLASNSITVLENLLCLASLKALDVGYNLIQKVRPGQVPASVLYLTTDGNPLEEMGEGEWKEVFEDLPLLRTLDCVDVDRGDDSEGEDEDEEDEEVEGEGDGGEGEAGGAGGGREGDGGEGSEEEEEEEELVDWESGQLQSAMRRIQEAGSLFDREMAAARERRREMVERQRRELAEEIASQEAQFREAKEGMERLRALMEEESNALAAAEAQAEASKALEAAEGKAGASGGGGGVNDID